LNRLLIRPRAISGQQPQISLPARRDFTFHRRAMESRSRAFDGLGVAGVGWLSYRNNRDNVTLALTASVFM